MPDKLMLFLAFIVPLSIQLDRFYPKLPVNLSLPSEPLIILLMFLFIFKFLLNGTYDKRIVAHPVTLAIFFYLTWILITSMTSELPLVSFKFLIAKLWFIIVFYLIGTQLFSKFKNIIRFGWLYTSSLILVVIYSISRFASMDISDHRLANKVVLPFYNDHTDYAAAISMILIFTAGYFFLRRKLSYTQKLLNLSFVVFFFIALILSYARAAWISLLISIVFLVLMKFKIRLRYIFLSIAFILGLFFTFQSDIMIALERNKQDSNKDFSKHISSITNVSTDASNKERINRWKCAIRMFKERPIFGFGPGTYQFLYAPYQKKIEMTIISTNHGDVGNAHSEYLGPLSEMGFMGMIAFLGIVITTMYTGSRLYFRSKRRKVRIMSITLLISLLTYYIHGVMNNFLDADKLSILFWGFTAMIVALDVYHTPSLKKLK